MIQSILNYSFMQNALMAALVASLICGIIGTIIVEKQLVSMSGGIAHASFGGIGLGYLLGIEPIIGGLFVATGASLAVGQIQRRTKTKADTVVSMMWSAGMAAGILFIALTPGYPPDMTSYLFGDILTVNDTYLRIMVGLALIMMVIVGMFYNYFKLYLFDEEYAKILKINVVAIETVLYMMIAFSIVVLIKVVGIILALALLTIPTASAKLFSFTLNRIMVYATGFSVLYSLLGLTISYYLNIPSGASIILVSITFYAILAGVKKIMPVREEI